jgi:CheY-like chemotaxis protein
MTRQPGDPAGGLLDGRLILLVEDDPLVALDLVQALEAEGAAVVGPAATVRQALDLMEATPGLDGAVLDVELLGELSFPVADGLRDRGIPFVFETGYDERILPEPYRHAPRIAKPVQTELMARVLARPSGCRPGRAEGVRTQPPATPSGVRPALPRRSRANGRRHSRTS